VRALQMCLPPVLGTLSLRLLGLAAAWGTGERAMPQPGGLGQPGKLA
jgi:hypothetical protein